MNEAGQHGRDESHVPIADFLCFATAPVVVSLVAAIPLLWSSVYWTTHPELHVRALCGVLLLQDTVTIAMMMVTLRHRRRLSESIPMGQVLTCASLSLMLWVVPMVTRSLHRFAFVRPDSWEIIHWRLADDWSEWMTHQHATDALRWSLIFLMLAILQRFLCNREHEANRYSIRALMIWTIIAAMVLRALIVLGWQPDQIQGMDLISLGTCLGLILCFRAVLLPPCNMRIFLAGMLVLALTIAGFAVYCRLVHTVQTMSHNRLELAIDIFGRPIIAVLIAWLAARIFGHRSSANSLNCQDPD